MKKVIFIFLAIILSCGLYVNANPVDSVFQKGKIGLEVKEYQPPFSGNYKSFEYKEPSKFSTSQQIAYIVILYMLAILYLTSKGYPLQLYITFSTLLKVKYNANEKNNLRETLESVFFIAGLIMLTLLFSNYLYIKGIINQEELFKSFVVILLSLSGLSFLYWLTIKYLSFLFEQTNASNFLIYVNKLFITLTVYPLMIANFIIIYNPTHIAIIAYWTAIAIIAIFFIIRTFYIVKYFLDARFSVFYLILYLCSVELIPIILVFKYILN